VESEKGGLANLAKVDVGLETSATRRELKAIIEDRVAWSI
jgi:hypothetical protein